jgi:hypothetical protein
VRSSSPLPGRSASPYLECPALGSGQLSTVSTAAARVTRQVRVAAREHTDRQAGAFAERPRAEHASRPSCKDKAGLTLTTCPSTHVCAGSPFKRWLARAWPDIPRARCQLLAQDALVEQCRDDQQGSYLSGRFTALTGEEVSRRGSGSRDDRDVFRLTWKGRWHTECRPLVAAANVPSGGVSSELPPWSATVSML